FGPGGSLGCVATEKQLESVPDQKAQDGKFRIDERPGLPKQRALANGRNRKLPTPVVRLVACGSGCFLNRSVLLICESETNRSGPLCFAHFSFLSRVQCEHPRMQQCDLVYV